MLTITRLFAARPEGRMPEQSEWLLAVGGAKRNPRYRATPHNAKNANIGNLGDNIRVFQTLFFEDRHSGGYANAPPPAKSTRAIALGIQPFRLDTLAAYYRISITASPLVMPNYRGAAAPTSPTHRNNPLTKKIRV